MNASAKLLSLKQIFCDHWHFSFDLFSFTAFVFGAFTIVLSFTASRLGTLVTLANSIFGALGGPLVATFLLGMFWKRANTWWVYNLYSSKLPLWRSMLGQTCLQLSILHRSNRYISERNSTSSKSLQAYLIANDDLWTVTLLRICNRYKTEETNASWEHNFNEQLFFSINLNITIK